MQTSRTPVRNVLACGDGAVLLQGVEEALDEIACENARFPRVSGWRFSRGFLYSHKRRASGAAPAVGSASGRFPDHATEQDAPRSKDRQRGPLAGLTEMPIGVLVRSAG
jgi:hypothetical protein